MDSNGDVISNKWLLLYVIEKLTDYHVATNKENMSDKNKLNISIYDISSKTRPKTNVSFIKKKKKKNLLFIGFVIFLLRVALAHFIVHIGAVGVIVKAHPGRGVLVERLDRTGRLRFGCLMRREFLLHHFIDVRPGRLEGKLFLDRVRLVEHLVRVGQLVFEYKLLLRVVVVATLMAHRLL